MRRRSCAGDRTRHPDPQATVRHRGGVEDVVFLGEGDVLDHAVEGGHAVDATPSPVA
jgi:hypothetical protein